MMPRFVVALSASLAAWIAITSASIAEVQCTGWNQDPKSLFDEATAADVARCIASGADPNSGAGQSFTPLHWAAAAGNLVAVTALLDAGADPNIRNQHGQTPLHWAAEGNSNPTIIGMLLDAGAEPSARTEAGRTPLHRAAYVNDNPAVIAALLDDGSEAKSRDEDGNTPWDLAQENNAIKGTDVYWRLNDARFD